MATTMNWRTVLKDQPIFNKLKESQAKLKRQTECRNIIALNDGDLFAWDPYKCCICTSNLKLLLNSGKQTPCQVLLCSNPPVFDVQSLLINRTGTLVAIIGTNGVSVLELPQRTGRLAQYAGGKERVSCKTVPVGERLFVGSRSLKVLHTDWHPGSDTDLHLVVLTSDNCLRIYDVSSPNTDIQTIQVSQTGSLSGSRATLSEVLGDQAVSFDFGPAVQLESKDKSRHSSTEKHEVRTAWPIYLLGGNGEVYYTLSSLNQDHRNKDTSVYGPLSMFPAADDNYGCDACSILCLPGAPSVLAIAMCGGKLYHCIVLNSGKDDEQTPTSPKWQEEAETSQMDTPPEPSLYVFESVELELSLTTISVDTDTPISDDDFSCPIRLHRDSGCAERYHCSHSAGVHTILLSWLPQIQRFCHQEERGQNEEGVHLTQITQDQAHVEHLICTKPLPSSPPSPILGLAVTSDRLLGPTLMCLTTSCECVCLPLTWSRQLAAPQLLSSSATTTRAVNTSPLKKLHPEPFDAKVKQILRRGASNPLLRTTKDTDLTPQECFQLLSRATQVFREEYVQRLDLAREEINRRVRVLREQKDFQQDEVNLIHQSRNILTEHAQNLVQRYTEAAERQKSLIDRCETLLRKVQSHVPELSDSEKKMHRELKVMEENLERHNGAIKQLCEKHEYQQRQMAAQAQTGSRAGCNFTRNQSQKLRDVLKQEGGDISELVKKVNDMKVTLQT